MTEQAETSAPEVEIAKPAPPKFVGDRPRLCTVPLEWPVEYDGKTYTEITVRRMTAGEVMTFIEQATAGGSPRLPMLEAPPEVIDALDADDADNVNKAVNDFLPRALQQAEQPD